MRDSFEEHQIQTNVREIIKHFRQVWGAEKGNNHYFHTLFPGAVRKNREIDWLDYCVRKVGTRRHCLTGSGDLKHTLQG